MIIRSEEIYNKAKSIVRSCGTRDTLKIARELSIYVHYIDAFDELLGMYTYRHKERHIQYAYQARVRGECLCSSCHH